MRNSYIANSAEALNLHNGTQTAIVVAMKVQPTPNKFNPQNVDFEMSKGDRRHKGTNVKPENLNCPLLGILDLSPYTIGQEVYVREECFSYTLGKETKFAYKDSIAEIAELELAIYLHEDQYAPIRFGSAATMPKSAARTRFKIVSCEAVRVKGLTVGNGLELGCSSGNWGAARDYIITRFGQSAWDNNDYIWFYKIEKI